MERVKDSRRLVIEVAFSAGVALAPYAVSVAGTVGPARVPVWAVAALFLISLLVFQVANLLSRRRRERRERFRAETLLKQDIICRLDHLEEMVSDIAPSKWWMRQRMGKASLAERTRDG
jgi:hypothetical protein